jgi:hypothetical protein
MEVGGGNYLHRLYFAPSLQYYVHLTGLLLSDFIELGTMRVNSLEVRSTLSWI